MPRKKYLRHDVYLQTEQRADLLAELARQRNCSISSLICALVDEEAERVGGRPVPLKMLARDLQRVVRRLQAATVQPASTQLKLL